MNKLKFNKKILLIGSGMFILIIMLLLIQINKTTNQQQNSRNQSEKIAIDNFTNDEMKDKTNDKTLVKEDINHKENVIDENTKKELDSLISRYYDISNTENQKDEITKNNNDDSKKMISHIKARTGIEKYENIKTYVRSGLKENTFIVFTAYDMKFINIDTLAPGMSVLYIKKDESGDLSIQEKEADKKLNAYINELTKEDEINSLIQNTNTRLKNILKKDESLTKFIEKLENVSQ